MNNKRQKFEEAYNRYNEHLLDSEESKHLREDQGIDEYLKILERDETEAVESAKEFFADFSIASAANAVERADLAKKSANLYLVEPLKKLLNDAGVSVEEKKELLKNDNCAILRLLVNQGVSFKSFIKGNKKVYQLGDFSGLEFQEEDAKNVYNNFSIVTCLLEVGRYSEFFDAYEFSKPSDNLELSRLFSGFTFGKFYKVSSDAIDQKELKEILTRMKSALSDSRKKFAQPITNQEFAKALGMVFGSEYMYTSNVFSKEVLKFIVDALLTLDEKDRAEVLCTKHAYYFYLIPKNTPNSIECFLDKNRAATLLKRLALVSEIVGDFESLGKVAGCLTAEQKMDALKDGVYQDYFTAQQVIDRHVKTMHSKDYHFKYCGTALCIASVFAFASIKQFSRFGDVSNLTKAVLSVGSVILGVLLAGEIYNNTPDDSRYGLKGLSSFSR